MRAVELRQDWESLASAQKRKAGVSLYSRWVNRPAGRALAVVLARAGVSPNGVTGLSVLSTGAGVVVLAVGRPDLSTGVLVWFLLALGFALDSADGQVARLTGRSSPQGEWLDHVVDAGKMVAVHAAVLVSWYRFDTAPGSTWLLVPLVFQLAAVVTFVGGTLTELLKRTRAGGPGRAPSTLRAVALLPADYGVFCLVFLLLGAGGWFVVAYTALAAVRVLVAAAFLVRWSRELGALDDAVAA